MIHKSSIIHFQVTQRRLQLIFTVVLCILVNKISGKTTVLSKKKFSHFFSHNFHIFLCIKSSIKHFQVKQIRLQLIFTVVPCILVNNISGKTTPLSKFCLPFFSHNFDMFLCTKSSIIHFQVTYVMKLTNAYVLNMFHCMLLITNMYQSLLSSPSG